MCKTSKISIVPPVTLCSSLFCPQKNNQTKCLWQDRIEQDKNKLSTLQDLRASVCLKLLCQWRFDQKWLISFISDSQQFHTGVLQSHQAECRLLWMTAAARHHHPQPSYSVIASVTSFCLDPQKKKKPRNSFSQDKMQSTATTFKLIQPGWFFFLFHFCFFCWSFYFYQLWLFQGFLFSFFRCYAEPYCARGLMMKADDATLAAPRCCEGLQTNESVLQHSEEMSSSSVAMSPLALRLEFSHAWRRH